jgi:alanyl-tRNA synthetase
MCISWFSKKNHCFLHPEVRNSVVARDRAMTLFMNTNHLTFQSYIYLLNTVDVKQSNILVP